MTGFAVQPKTDCPHVERVLDRLGELSVDTGAACGDCGDTRENWLCLMCNAVRCSRYMNGDMVQHVEAAESPCRETVLASYADFSFWCPTCNSYIVHPKLAVLKQAMQLSKFGE